MRRWLFSAFRGGIILLRGGYFNVRSPNGCWGFEVSYHKLEGGFQWALLIPEFRVTYRRSFLGRI